MLLALALVVFGGRVVEDHTGNPLASVDIQVSRPGVSQLAAHLETTAEGRFEAEGLPDGVYRLRLSKPNFLDAELNVTLPLTQPVALRLVRTGVIAGRIADASNRPVTAAHVGAMQRPPGGGPLRRVGQWVTPNDRGQFRLHGLAPGQYIVAVVYGASTPAVGGTGRAILMPGVGSGSVLYPSNSRPQTFTISGGEEFRGIDFLLSPGAQVSVSGNVDGRKGQWGYWIALTSVDEPSLASAVAQTDTDAVFKLDGVPSGSYYLFASGPSRARNMDGGFLEGEPLFSRTRLEVGTQDVKDLRLAMEPGRSLTFVLSPKGSCPSTARLTLRSVEDWAMRLEASTDLAAGKPATIANLAPSRYALTATTTDNVCYGPVGRVFDLTSPPDTKPVEVVLTPAGTLQGRTTGAAAASVTLLAGGEALQSATPDTNGRFTFTNLKPGRYRLAAQTATKARWLNDLANLMEVEVMGGVVTNVELPVQ